MKDFKLVFAFLSRHRKNAIIAIITVIIETSFELLIPYVMSILIDKGVQNQDMNTIYICGAIISFCALMSLLNGQLYSKYAALMAAGFGADLREEQFKKIQSYSFSNIDSFDTSSLVTRVINDSNVMQNTVASGLRPIVRAPIMLVLGIVLSLAINWKLAMIFVALAPLLGLILFLILRSVSPRYILMQKALDGLNSKVQENLVAIRAVKAFVRKPYEEKRFDAANQEYTDIVKNTFLLANLNMPAFQFVMYAATILFMWFGGNMIISGEILPGSLAGLLSYVMQTFNSLMMISSAFLLLSKSLASVYRINEVLTTVPDIEDGKSQAKISRGEIEFKDVSFRYAATAEENVLSDINLHIKPAQTIGILGPTGSAKSTLVSLIPRLYDVSQGQVLIDGVNVKDYSLVHLRDSIAMVLQKSTLFSGTLLSNLKWGNPDPTKEELEKALRISCVDEILPHLSNGLETEMGEGGNNVSGGQKQRICLARALLKHPKVLILDDTTSAVDTATERKIRDGLREENDMTKIIISQRILSVMDADEIIILSDGRIADIGTHEELKKRNPIYQDLCASQLKGVIEDV
jgi:ATP-binding cassette, subfamily B, multidrug efflux pump